MKDWLKNAIVYQIYPTSFYDGNGDGVGDLNGITRKLDYVKSLGVDVVWINPFFVSPFMDGGYDVADYYAIDKRFGDFNDFDALIKRANGLGLKIIIDLVIGHTSWENEWFKRSAEARKNEYSDRYIWSDSIFSGGEKLISGLYKRDGCFYVNYYACQPALNYGFNDVGKSDGAYSSDKWKMHYTDERLKPVRDEVLRIIKFWTDKGVSGFRVDLANSLVKGCVYDSDDDGDIAGLKYVWNDIIGRARNKYPDILFVAEWCYPKNAVGKCGFDIDYIAHDTPSWNKLFRCEKGTNIISAFEDGHNYFSPDGSGDVTPMLDYAESTNAAIDGKGGFSIISGCHDSVRLAEKKSVSQLKTIFAFLLTFRHIPFIYYGDEIGIRHDFTVNRDGGYIRTGARTPMQWTEGKNRGFSETDGELYLPAGDCAGVSVEAQERDENSLLNTVKRLIAIKKRYNCLGYGGELKVLRCDGGGYPLVYSRSNEAHEIVVAINPSRKTARVDLDYGEVLLSHGAEFSNGKRIKITEGFAVLSVR